MKRFASARLTLRTLAFGGFAGIASIASIVGLSVIASSAVAAPVTVGGATLDAPANCETADGALVCKLDGQQFELWVTRKPLAPDLMPSDPIMKKMAFFTDVHETAITSIMRSTGNATATQFSTYGTYSAMGSALPGKGVPSSPSVRFASVLHDEAIWEIMEVVATRTPAVDALATKLQASFKLPSTLSTPKVNPVASGTAPSPAPGSAAARAGAPAATAPIVIEPPAPDAWFHGKRVSLQYPTFLEPTIALDSTEALEVTFKHKTRPDGPQLTLLLRAPSQRLGAHATVAALRRTELTAAMTEKSASVEINSLGTIPGAGFALLGVPGGKQRLSGVESIETVFVADSSGRQLEVRMNTAQKHSGEAQAVWGLLAKSITIR